MAKKLSAPKPARTEQMPAGYAKSLVDHAVSLVSFDHSRLARVETDIARWKADEDEIAKLSGLPSLTGCERAVAQLEQVRSHLSRGSLIPATYCLNIAEGIYSMRVINEQSATQILRAARGGLPFVKGRKPGTAGPIRKAIARLLKAHPEMKNEALWTALSNRPPTGWEFADNSIGKYATGPEGANMDYPRFRNVASEERKKLKR